MTVATHSVPDFTSDDAATYKAKLDANDAVHHEIAGAYACHETSTPGMTVNVDAGRMLVNGTLVSNSQQTTGTITAPSGNPRIDRIVIDKSTGVVSVITGSEAASPTAPNITPGKIPVAQILLDDSPATTAITNSLITDERVPLIKPSPRMVMLDSPVSLITSTSSVSTATAQGHATLDSVLATHVILRVKVTALAEVATDAQVAGVAYVGNSSTTTTEVARAYADGKGTTYAPNHFDTNDVTVGLDGNYDFWYKTSVTAPGSSTVIIAISMVGYYEP